MTATGDVADRREAVRQRLRDDYAFYAERAVRIVNKQGAIVRFELRRPQRRLMLALMRQRELGIPQRAVVLKARQKGFSTVSQSMIIQRVTQQSNHRAMVLAQDRETAGALYNIGHGMWARLPSEIKPPAAQQSGTQDRKYIVFGEPSLQLRREGVMGLSSMISIATPKGLVGRGITPRSLQISEFAHWPVSDKLTDLLQGVPDDPDTLVVIESTPAGHNHFKDEWDRAVNGESGYLPFFSPWYEDDEYRRPFMDVGELHDFVVGGHKYGDEEPQLLEQIRGDLERWATEDGEAFVGDELDRRALEHLNWRRWAIGNKTRGSVDIFMQEYPSDPESAFLASGRRVFDGKQVQALIRRCELTDPDVRTVENPGPVVGLLRADTTVTMVDRTKQRVKVPQSVLWVPRVHAQPGEVSRWRLWEAPRKAMMVNGQRVPEGQYIVFADAASGDVDERGTEHAEHAAVVIDHRTRKQVAELAVQMDSDLFALELLLVALHFNKAWINVERTGGWGLPMLRKLKLDWHYPRVWTDESKDKRTTKRSDRLGWETSHITKPLMIALAVEMLREENDGIRSLKIARQMLSYIYDDKGHAEPEAGKLADTLMAWMGAQITAKLRPIRPDEGASSPGKAKRSRTKVRR